MIWFVRLGSSLANVHFHDGSLSIMSPLLSSLAPSQLFRTKPVDMAHQHQIDDHDLGIMELLLDDQRVIM